MSNAAFVENGPTSELSRIFSRLSDDVVRHAISEEGHLVTVVDVYGNTVGKLKIVADNEITEHEKLEYIHSTLQDVKNCIEWGKVSSQRTVPTLDLDEDMINNSMAMVEDIREKHFDNKGELIK